MDAPVIRRHSSVWRKRLLPDRPGLLLCGPLLDVGFQRLQACCGLAESFGEFPGSRVGHVLLGQAADWCRGKAEDRCWINLHALRQVEQQLDPGLESR